MLLTADVCLYRDAPDRSLSAEGFDIRSLLTQAAAPPGRAEEARLVLLSAFADSAQVQLSFGVFQKALSLLQCLPKEFPMPEIAIESESSVEFDWDEDARRVVMVTVDEQSRVGFASLVHGDSNYGRLEFAEGAREIPETLRGILSRIYARRGARRAA